MALGSKLPNLTHRCVLAPLLLLLSLSLFLFRTLGALLRYEPCAR